MNQIGMNIKKWRQARGLTQEQLAEKMHVTRQAVSSWETGKNQPDVETLERLTVLFQISVEEIIYGRKHAMNERGTVVIEKTKKVGKAGVSFGAALAMVISYTHWQSIGWAIFHGLLGWLYVLYYIIRY